VRLVERQTVVLPYTHYPSVSRRVITTKIGSVNTLVVTYHFIRYDEQVTFLRKFPNRIQLVDGEHFTDGIMRGINNSTKKKMVQTVRSKGSKSTHTKSKVHEKRRKKKEKERGAYMTLDLGVSAALSSFMSNFQSLLLTFWEPAWAGGRSGTYTGLPPQNVTFLTSGGVGVFTKSIAPMCKIYIYASVSCCAMYGRRSELRKWI
jgi:hypothetical protein